MRRRFITLDVFTRRRFAGNPLGMVFESEGLGTDAMQTIAREIGHPETVFVLPPQDSGHKAGMRIFTPASELPFAGHPTIGAAVGLARASGGGRQSLVIEEKVGPVSCVAQMHDADSGYAEFKLPQLPQRVGDLPDAATMASALRLSSADIDADAYPPSRWSAGVAFSMVPVRSLDAAARARPDPALFDKVFAFGGHAMVYVICAETANAAHQVHARMFAPSRGIAEDPATGSAVAAFAGLYTTSKGLADGTHKLTIEQGYEMGRPSEMRLSLKVEGGALCAASIGGDAVVVSEGVIEA